MKILDLILPKFHVVVYGEKRTLTYSEARTVLQKELAADVKWREAAEARKCLEPRLTDIIGTTRTGALIAEDDLGITILSPIATRVRIPHV